MQIGVLALQGDYAAHKEKIESIGVPARLVRDARELEGVWGLVLPGGESSTMLRLLSDELERALVTALGSGIPTLATCAGTILLARHVSHPEQHSLGFLDISLERNGYGRQRESFVERSLTLTPCGRNLLTAAHLECAKRIEGVFIRAPKVLRLGAGVDVLALHDDQPVLFRSGRILAATFHPELSPEDDRIHRLFLSMCETPNA